MRALLLVTVAAGMVTAAAYGTYRYLEKQNPGRFELDRAWRQVRATPRDADAWAALGDAQSAIDQLRSAEESYRTALRLGTADASVAGRLGFLMYGRGKDDQALPLLEHSYEAGADLPLLRQTVEQLRGAARQVSEQRAAARAALRRQLAQVEAKSAPQEPPGDCTVELEKRGTYRTSMDIGDDRIHMVVDTGASITAISEDRLIELGVPIDYDTTINAITATGPASFPTALLPVVSIAGRSVEGVTVAVCNGCGGRFADGLLGLDVQAALGIELDLKNNRLHFLDCDD